MFRRVAAGLGGSQRPASRAGDARLPGQHAMPPVHRPRVSSLLLTGPLLLAVVFLTLSNNPSQTLGRRSLTEELRDLRELCDNFFSFGDWASRAEPYWEHLYASVASYDKSTSTSTAYPPYTPSSIGYVLTLMSCPGDDYEPGVDTQFDPGHAFFDAAAVLKYGICHQTIEGGDITAEYNSTMYAIVHPQAVHCEGPNGESYDRVRVLTDLGYHVLIHGEPVAMGQIQSTDVRNNVYNDAGLRDLMKIYAYKFVNHPVVVMVDSRTLLVHDIDWNLGDFISQTDKTVMYTTHYPTNETATGRNRAAKTSFFMLKPSLNTMEDILNVYRTTSFDIDAHWNSVGWGSSGVGGFPGHLGADGILHYYYHTLNPDKMIKTDRCVICNDNDDPMKLDANGDAVCRDPYTCQDCRTYPVDDIRVAEMVTVCGEPWKCYYDENWDTMTTTLCEEFHRKWFSLRVRYEESHWHAAPPTDRTGTYKPDVFLGYCDDSGATGYNRMIEDKFAPDSCDPNTISTEAVSTVTSSSGETQDQKLILTTGETTATPTACVSGQVIVDGSGGNQAFIGNIVSFVIDVNGDYQNEVDTSSLDWTSSGFSFGELIVSGLNPEKGSTNTLTATIVIDYDGDETTTTDRNTLSSSNNIVGSLV